MLNSLNKTFFILILFLHTAFCNENPKVINIYGDTNYSESKTKSLTTNLSFEYKHKLFEPDHKKWGLYIKGVVSSDYDHFQNIVKLNSFTTISLDF